MARVYPVMQEILKPEYLDMWVEGLKEVLIENGVSEEVAEEITGAVPVAQPLYYEGGYSVAEDDYTDFVKAEIPSIIDEITENPEWYEVAPGEYEYVIEHIASSNYGEYVGNVVVENLGIDLSRYIDDEYAQEEGYSSAEEFIDAIMNSEVPVPSMVLVEIMHDLNMTEGSKYTDALRALNLPGHIGYDFDRDGGFGIIYRVTEDELVSYGYSV